MAVVRDNMHGHVKLCTSSTQVCLLYFQGTTGFDHTPSWSKIGSHLVVNLNTLKGEGMAVVMDNMHGHVRLCTSSTQVCLLYFRVPLVLTTSLPGVR